MKLGLGDFGALAEGEAAGVFHRGVLGREVLVPPPAFVTTTATIAAAALTAAAVSPQVHFARAAMRCHLRRRG
ncbi:hypothetical protein ACQPXS_10075 [Streptomyces sp. CA-142005]|uniref:hypothetical protein n=1 Tax=Streptomyces sp. CA-142005 TaxID=3240052 RepID=UPI003D89D9CE